MINHPSEQQNRGAVHRRRPDGVVEYWSAVDGFWVVGSNCRLCIYQGYPTARYEDTWAEPVRET